MIILDTDHISVLKYSGSDAATAHGAVGHGWQRVNRDDDHHGRRADARLDGFHLQGTASTQAIAPDRELIWVFSLFSNTRFCHSTRKQRMFSTGFGRIRMGSMDRKIAAIAIASNALLLTANRQDYERIPALRFENWMD